MLRPPRLLLCGADEGKEKVPERLFSKAEDNPAVVKLPRGITFLSARTSIDSVTIVEPPGSKTTSAS